MPVNDSSSFQSQSRPLRVLYLVSLFPCWSETFIVREIAALIDQGVDVRIFSYKHPHEDLVQDDAKALQDRTLYPVTFLSQAKAWCGSFWRRPKKHMRVLFKITQSFWRRPESLVKTLVVYWRSQSLVVQCGDWVPDVIHAHWATYPSTGAWVVGQLQGLPFGFTAHAHDIFLEDQMLAEKLKASAHAITISAYNIAYVQAKIGQNLSDKFQVVHCGIELEHYRFDRSAKQAQRLLAVGRMIPMKGFEVLIEACAQLRNLGQNFECHIIGDGPLRESLVDLVDKYKLGDCVKLLGVCPQEQVRQELYEASVFVMPSIIAEDGDRDGIPVALMEAMAVGTSVVSTTVSGIPELVLHESNGLLVPAKDSQALARAVGALLADPLQQECFARAARATIEADFSIDHEVSKLMQQLKSSASS